MNRRKFVKNVLAAGAGASFLSAGPLWAESPIFSRGEKFRVGLIGANGMGWSNMNAFLKVPGYVNFPGLCKKYLAAQAAK